MGGGGGGGGVEVGGPLRIGPMPAFFIGTGGGGGGVGATSTASIPSSRGSAAATVTFLAAIRASGGNLPFPTRSDAGGDGGSFTPQPPSAASTSTPAAAPGSSITSGGTGGGWSVDVVIGLSRAYIRGGDPAAAVELLSDAATALGSTPSFTSSTEAASSSSSTVGGSINASLTYPQPQQLGAAWDGGSLLPAPSLDVFSSQLISVLLVERAAALLRCGEWQLALHSGLTPVLAAEPTNMPALALALCVSLSREGPASVGGLNRLQALATGLAAAEPRTWGLWVSFSAAAARLCLRCLPALSVTLALARAASAGDPECSFYAEEVGVQRLLIGDAAGAGSAFRDAAALDEGNASAVCGGIAAQVAAGALADAEAQLEMFRVVAESTGRTPQLALLDAQLAWRLHGDRAAQLTALDEAAVLHLTTCGLDAQPLNAGGGGGRRSSRAGSLSFFPPQRDRKGEGGASVAGSPAFGMGGSAAYSRVGGSFLSLAGVGGGGGGGGSYLFGGVDDGGSAVIGDGAVSAVYGGAGGGGSALYGGSVVDYAGLADDVGNSSAPSSAGSGDSGRILAIFTSPVPPALNAQRGGGGGGGGGGGAGGLLSLHPSHSAIGLSLAHRGGAGAMGLLTRLPPPTAGDVGVWYAACAPLLLLDLGREYLQRVDADPSVAAAVAAGGGRTATHHGRPHSGTPNSSNATSSAATAGVVGGVLGLPPHTDATTASSPTFIRGVTLVEMVLSLLPSCLPAWLLLAQAHAACGEGVEGGPAWEDAKVAATAALSVDPRCPEALMLMGHVCLGLGDAR